LFSNSFCSSEDQMMIGARFVFVNFWCKQKLFGKGIVVLVKTNRKLIICWLSYMMEPMESICLDLVCSWVQMGLPLVQQYLIQFEKLARKLVPQVGEHFEKWDDESQHVCKPMVHHYFFTLLPFLIGTLNLGCLPCWGCFLCLIVSCLILVRGCKK
jgi:hypothetical protein